MPSFLIIKNSLSAGDGNAQASHEFVINVEILGETEPRHKSARSNPLLGLSHFFFLSVNAEILLSVLHTSNVCD